MNIAISLNRRYYRYTYVMLTSLYENHEIGSLSVYVLHRDLGKEEQEGLTKCTLKYGNRITFLPVDQKLFPKELPVTDMWSLETYFRLLMLDLLPKDLERILYLDVDIIVNKDISPLYHTDFEGKHFVACRDLGAEGPFQDIRAELFNRHIEEGYPYCNAGIMLWNLSVLRGTYSFAYYMQLAKDLNYRILAPDQDLLNYAHYNQIKLADEYLYNLWGRYSYNLGIRYEQVKAETPILHYTGFKPWSGEYVHYDIEKLWWDYARLTPFYQELLEEFLDAALMNPLVNDTVKTLSDEKQVLTTELHKTQLLCQKLSALL